MKCIYEKDNNTSMKKNINCANDEPYVWNS